MPKQTLTVEVDIDQWVESVAEYRCGSSGDSAVLHGNKVVTIEAYTAIPVLIVRPRKVWQRPAWLNKRWKWLAMDESGSWYCYDREPKRVGRCWDGDGFIFDLSPDDYDPEAFNLPQVTDWQESLFEIVD